MNLSPVTSKSEAEALRNHAMASVDLGFSGSGKTCGLAVREAGCIASITKALHFGDCVREVAVFSDAAELVLIIEAPLSAAFDIRQNPMSRGTFESSPRPRWWSLGAGAAMALAAHHFLRGIMQYSTSANRVHVLEGFVVGADSVEHDRVAGHLLDCFLGGVPGNWVTPQGAGLISSLSWADPSAATECPLILCPSSA